MSTPACTSFAAELEATFRPDELDAIGRDVGFARRLRVITPARLVTALVWVLGALRVESIADVLRGFNQTTGTATAYKAFWCRLARPGFVALMKAVVQRCMVRLAVETLAFEEDSPFHRFKDIRIQDGTSFALAHSLSGVFPGRFTTVDPAAVEIHAEFSAVPNPSTHLKKKDDWIRLCTNLPAADFPSELVARVYRFRWQIELVFKEWKSYANLHKFDSSNASIVEGLIWAALCAAIVKRFIAHAAQRELALPVSTRRTAMLLPYFLEELMCAILREDEIGFRRGWKQTIAFIAANGLRANPDRDRKKGRLRVGLRQVAVT